MNSNRWSRISPSLFNQWIQHLFWDAPAMITIINRWCRRLTKQGLTKLGKHYISCLGPFCLIWICRAFLCMSKPTSIDIIADISVTSVQCVCISVNHDFLVNTSTLLQYADRKNKTSEISDHINNRNRNGHEKVVMKRMIQNSIDWKIPKGTARMQRNWKNGSVATQTISFHQLFPRMSQIQHLWVKDNDNDNKR